MIPANDITGLILAGGQGSRMGHADKGLVPFRDEPMVRHAVQRLSPQVGKLIISANRNAEAYRAFGIPVVPDALQDFAGPLAGMQAGLMHCDTPYMAVVPCDSPFLPNDLVQRLAQSLLAQIADAAVAQTIEENERWLQPVFCLLKVSLLPSLTHFLQNGGRKVDNWFIAVKAVRVDFADASAFRNINTPQDLQTFDCAIKP